VTTEAPELSIAIPVFNEERNLPVLAERLFPALDALGKSWEVIFSNDGSRDRSQELLEEMAARFPDRVRVIELSSNAGQHMALMAAFERARGAVLVTLDADLQNPPEEIGKLLAAIEAGADSVGGIRQQRKDTFFRRAASLLVNRATAAMTGIRLRDYGCMLRAYRREVYDAMARCPERSTFLPALGARFSRKVVEIPVAHEERAAGPSQYNLYKLIRLNFDLMTGFSVVPLQIVSFVGLLTALFGLSFGVFLGVRRLIVGAEVEGVFTLFAILFFVLGILMFSLGIVGEYVGRIYQEVRERPRFVIRKTIGFEREGANR
jgi:undecaprenyl-phosphate 4-deoxy-4-formamido-L-arabinose transferase